MTALKYRVPLHPGEAYRSFASRLGAANGSPALIDFSRDMAIDLAGMGRGETEAFERLASLGGVDGDTLRQSAIVPDHPYFLLGGQRIARAFINRSRLRVCPSCIRDDIENGSGPPHTRPWLRSAWSVKLVRTCPRHGTMLVEPDVEVPSCYRQDIAAICQDRKALAAMTVQADPASPSPLEDWMAARLAGQEGDSAFLASLPFHAAVRFTEIVGASVLHGRLFAIAKFTERQWLEAGTAGFEVTSAGEDSITEFFGTFNRNFRSAKRQVGGKILFGSLYSWLQTTREPGIEQLRTLAREYVIDNFPVGPGDEFLGPIHRRRWHSLHTARKEYGVHPKRLRRLLDEMGLVGPESAHLSDHRVRFDAAAADGFLRGIRDGLTSPEAMAYAGANLNQWKDLTTTGLVPAVTERTTKTLAAYSREDIDAFLAKVRYSTGRGDPSTMTDLTKAARVAQCTVLEIIHMVIDRKLDKVAESPSRKGLAGVLVDPREVIGLLPPKEKKGLTTAEACERLVTCH